MPAISTPETIFKIDTAWHPLADGNPPLWATAWGHDEYGVWVEFTIKQVSQRLRWIAPGQFMMGSPPEEPSRYDDEGPCHPVLITKGYWLFDTPCTQALWQAVCGDTPSRFITPERPVERVSWEDCQGFLEKINAMVPGLELTLPSEAQWEKACRAGASSAIYTGALQIIGDGNAPALDDIAWYGGNSGVDFELEKGDDIGHLSNRQFDQNPSGTHPVALKQPNPMGLYDMLGNVWEWCEDGKRDYTAASETDPVVPLGVGAERVIRGGSWNDSARFCRSACRDWYSPDGRGNILGFRCARVQE